MLSTSAITKALWCLYFITSMIGPDLESLLKSASAGAWGSPQSAAHDEQEDGQLSGPSLAQTHKT